MFGRGKADNDRYLPGKWRVQLLSRPSYGWTNCTDVVIFANGPWFSFKDHNGRVHIPSARAELIAEKAA